MKKIYYKPTMEVSAFRFTEHIASSGESSDDCPYFPPNWYTGSYKPYNTCGKFNHNTKTCSGPVCNADVPIKE